MTLAWMTYILLLTVVLGITALGLERLSRRSGWGTRWVWAAAIGASLVIPAMLLTLPREGSAPQATIVSGAPIAQPVGQGIAQLTHPVQRAAAPTLRSLNHVLVSGWIVLSTAMIAAIALSWFRLRRAAVNWTRTKVAGADVFVSANLGPAVVGFFPGHIVLPQWMLQADVSVQRITVLHESQHLAARDPQLLLAALSCVALMPWNLPLWWLLQRLRAAVEIDCDARVLGAGEDVAVYGSALLEVAGSRTRLPLLAAALIEPTSQLERRIRSLDTSVVTIPKSLALVATMALLGIAGTAIAQIAAPQPPRIGALMALTMASGSGPELLDALIEQDLSRATALIDAGANVDYRRAGDGTPLIVATRNGDLRMVELLLAQGADANRESLGDGNPLIIAAASGNERMASMLVAAGARVNAFVEHDETPLINAARGGHLNIVKYLVGQGADVSFSVIANKLEAPERRSALSEAEKYGHRNVADYLRANGARS